MTRTVSEYHATCIHHPRSISTPIWLELHVLAGHDRAAPYAASADVIKLVNDTDKEEWTIKG